jgi:hypothetical protein
MGSADSILPVDRSMEHEADFLRLTAQTLDGVTHQVVAHMSQGKWFVAGSVDGRHIEGRIAKTPEEALANWLVFYQRMKDH